MLLDTIKKVAVQTSEVNMPATFLFGEVISTSPLKIRVDNRFDIGEEQVVLMREFRAGGYPTHTHTIEPHTHGVPQHTTETADMHSHAVKSITTNETPLTTNAEQYSGLISGDKVVLLRNHGGQKYLVLGRM